MKNLRLLIALLLMQQTAALAQQKISIGINDFENDPPTQNWWRDNPHVKFLYDHDPAHQHTPGSQSCLYVRWDSLAGVKPFTWFTDLKADTMAADGMEATWAQFRANTWLSFWCKAGSGDSLLLHYLVLSKGHSSKWGATQMLPAKVGEWTFYKVRFADLTYDDWGKVKADFDLNTAAGRCFEAGLRSGAAPLKGFIEAWFDDIKLTNYEPIE